ncbi:MAG TPA: biotin-dependent carboxyltransferase family protein [Vicinamibacterales bacterium]
MTALVVERPGLLTTVQDAGRRGGQHLGIPVSGWMDPCAAAMALALAGAPPDAALLEITAIGPTLRVEGTFPIAVAGAEFTVQIGTRVRRVPFVEQVSDGEVVTFRERLAGARAYLAAGGGLQTTAVLGSRSTDLRARLGGINGRAVVAGDRLPVAPAPARTAVEAAIRCSWLRQRTLRLLPPPECEAAVAGLRDALCGTPATVSPRSDRMGYRLECARPLPVPPDRLLSQPTAPGLVQVPPDGRPILLMSDRQTTGGYAIAGVVAAADIPVAAQLLPGDTVVFAACSWEEAQAAHRARARELQEAIAAFGS